MSFSLRGSFVVGGILEAIGLAEVEQPQISPLPSQRSEPLTKADLLLIINGGVKPLESLSTIPMPPEKPDGYEVDRLILDKMPVETASVPRFDKPSEYRAFYDARDAIHPAANPFLR